MRKTVVLISCASKKLSHRARVGEMYTSTLFKLQLAYARKLEPAAVYVLSAKHGLLDLDEQIDPYEMTLNTMSAREAKLWASEVLEQIKQLSDLEGTTYVFLAGDRYRKHLVPAMESYDVPLKGLRIGEQLQRLKALTR